MQFSYLYDFGDGWDHVVKVEKVLPGGPGMDLPTCVGGDNACPPEDVGGVGGYEYFLQAIVDPAHPDHEQMLEWIGESFDPTDFDVLEIAARLESQTRRRTVRR